ncbi:PQQ-binding-like beta-propeller repeat protein [Streptomyces sp. NPDC005931]|uniref:protein kinase domain-containing protein n=1 Tax=Streptomyces sp. NPDC005931 TaxID=3364737 RepID=UPI003683CB8B
MPLHRDDPKSVGGYRLLDRLGAGGMGVVYRGRARSGRDVALKVVHAHHAEDPVFRSRFRQEIAAVRKVSGAFTAPVLDADPDAARPWMATQYVPGPSLARRVRDGGVLTGSELRRLALGLVEALRDIHGAGVVHRDLKPANVLLGEDGPRVIDFGISRAVENHQTLTETGQMVGTPPFMSPEQLTDARQAGPASDVFSLGSLLAYAATGRGPFDAGGTYPTAYQVVHGEPELDGVDAALRGILARCLAKEPAHRPGLDELAEEFASVLSGAEADDPATVLLRDSRPDRAASRRPGPSGPPDSKARARRLRPRTLAAVAGLVGALVVGLTAHSLTGAGRADGGDGPQAWRPWQTTVYEPAPRGARQALDVPSVEATVPGCQVAAGALYCAGYRTLPVRLDGRTGRTVWRAGTARAGQDEGVYSSTVLGVRDDTVLVRQTVSRDAADAEVTSVLALDAATGERLWARQVDEVNAAPVVVGDLVVLPEDGGSLTARSPRTGSERWRAALPGQHSCGPTPVGGVLYLQCFSQTEGDRQDSLMVALDLTDGTARSLPLAIPDTDLLGAYDGQLVLLTWGPAAPDGDQTYAEIVLMDGTGSSLARTKLAEAYRGHATLAGGILWFTSSDGELTAVSPSSGRALWRSRTGVRQPGPARYDARTRTVYTAGGDGSVAGLHARTGDRLWRTPPRTEPERAADEGPEVLVDGRTLVVPTPGGGVFSLDPAHPGREPDPG